MKANRNKSQTLTISSQPDADKPNFWRFTNPLTQKPPDLRAHRRRREKTSANSNAGQRLKRFSHKPGCDFHTQRPTACVSGGQGAGFGGKMPKGEPAFGTESFQVWATPALVRVQTMLGGGV